MITARLIRYYSDLKVTLGLLKFNMEHSPIYTLELPWRENAADISCIPTGVYKVTPYSSEKHPNVYQVNDVINREFILLHDGNKLSDTLGCILSGRGVDSTVPLVSHSDDAMDLIRQLVGKNEFTLTVENL